MEIWIRKFVKYLVWQTFKIYFINNFDLQCLDEILIMIDLLEYTIQYKILLL